MDTEKKEKMKRAYETALLSQGACNLSGLAHGLAEAMEALWEEANEQGKGTDYVNNHPVVRLYLEQMNFLCQADYSESYRACIERSKN
jgi:hypothetical protein